MTTVPPIMQLRSAATTAYLGIGDARDALPELDRGIARLACFSPPYGGLLDYARAAEACAAQTDAPIWRQHTAALSDYLAEHGAVLLRLVETLATDATVAIEIDNERLPAKRYGKTALVCYPDLWVQLLEAVGLRLVERITLVRPLALGRRSGLFKQHAPSPTTGRPGQALPDNVTSTLLIAAQGDPLARLRRDATPADFVDRAWAEPYLKNCWKLARPARRTAARIAGHPCPMDREMTRAVLRLYSLGGDVVIDPYAGEGTVGQVAVEEGRVPILIEREAPFARLAQTELAARGALVQPLTAAPRPRGRVVLLSAQLALPLDPVLSIVARRAFLSAAATDDVTARHRDIAARMAREFGVGVTPELVALFLRAERAHVRDVKADRSAA